MKAGLVAFARRHLDLLASLALYGVLYAAWNLAGGTFRVWPDLWQLLPWPPLLQDLWGSLLDLHGQPPLLNLLFGVALQAAVALGTRVEALLQPLYFAAGAVTVAAVASLAVRLVARPLPRWAAILLFVANPFFYASLNYLFYTAWELLLLSVGALLAFRYFERPGAGRLAAALAPAVLLVYTRSLFHPLWFVLLAGLLLLLGRPVEPRRRMALLGVAAASLLLVAAWPLKNLSRFGFFGFSSWSGLSLARGLPTGEPLLPSGYPERLAAFARYSSDPLPPAAALAAQSRVPPEFRDRPTLALLAKPDGSPNWNHYALIPLSRELGAAAVARLREEPSLLFWKSLDFYLNGYSLYEARWPYRGDFSPEMTVGHGWASAYETVVFQRFRAYDPASTRLTTGFALVFPVVLGAAAVAMWRRRRSWGPAERTLAVMLLGILWVLALVLFVDGPEGNRVRFCTEPYLFLGAAWLLGGRSGDGSGGSPAV
jgi:hypothetical protein